MPTRAQRRREHGFTLVETFFAVLLLSLAFGAFVDLLVKSFQATVTTQRTFIAVSLAQEGLDLMRNKRDNSVLHALSTPGYDWRTNLVQGTSHTYQPDASNATWLEPGQSFPSAGGTPAYVCRVTSSGTNQGKYVNCQGSGMERVSGNFVRTVTTRTISGSTNAIVVESKVVWDANPTGITLSTFLYKIY